jgi:DNA segregation ATPase FtsK/SpoIIIE, S-DNA-T family
MAHGNTTLARFLLWFAAYVNVALLFVLLCSASSDGAGVLWAVLLAGVVDAAVGFYAIKQGLVFELLQERTWKAVCGGVGFSDTTAAWGVGVGLPRRTQKAIYPKLREVYGTRDSWRGIVTPFAGQTVTEYTKQADAFALAFHVPFVTFSIAANGLISIRAGQVPVPDAYDHPGQLDPHEDDTNMRLLPQVSATPDQWTDVPELSTRTDARELLQHVPMARDLDGRAWHMPIEGQHVFIAARTGGGKGSWIWSLVLGLAPAWRAGLVTFYGCDPKRLELAIGRDYWEQYADTGEAIVALLEQCVHAMHERANILQGKVRKFTPNQETPLIIIVVDELGYITSMMPDKKLRMRAEDAIVTLLSQGRAVGYALVGAVQDPRKETVNCRDLFSIRIAGGLPEPMIDLVLGGGAHDAGALCEQIPLGNAGAGVGYVISETSLKPLCIRSAWCDDAAIQRALARNRP